jgi:hypothetical protein
MQLGNQIRGGAPPNAFSRLPFPAAVLSTSAPNRIRRALSGHVLLCTLGQCRFGASLAITDAG